MRQLCFESFTSTLNLYLQFRRSVFRIFRRLLFAYPAEIPEHYATIAARTSENGLLERMPCQRRDRILMTHQRVQLDLEIAKVPQPDSLIRRTAGEKILGGWIECKSVDCVSMTIDRLDCCRGRRRIPNVQDLEREVIRYAPDQGGMQWMMLYVVDNSSVMCVGPRSVKRFVAGRKLGDVPMPSSIQRSIAARTLAP